MSEVQNTTASTAPAEASTEHTAPSTVPESVPAISEPTSAAEKTEETPAVPAEEKATESADPVTSTAAIPEASSATEAAETKPVEPVTEGFLGYKAPGLLKQFTFAKKDFWFSDEPITPQHLDQYLRGEKAEISHPVVAWASQSGKGLLFFTKKGDSTKTHPAGVLPLYDATDLKKVSPHEFSFRLHGHNHAFKASSDTERDGWYASVEKSVELGKATKESVRESEGYQAELKKLSTPHIIAGAGVAKKSTEADKTETVKRTGSSDGDEEIKKNKKSRSTSRGVFDRLRGKKDELEAKAEEKKEEKKVEKEEKKIEKEEAKAEPATEATPAAATVAPVEDKKEEPVEAAAVAGAAGTTAAAATEEKPKINKRNSIFGKLQAGFKSPIKEKEHKDVELKPEVPAKDTPVAENPPQLPETATAGAIDTPAVTAAADITPEVTEPTAEPAKETPETVITPSKEKKNFLSGLGFLNKRDRSVSPSQPLKEQPTKTETAEEAVEPTKAAEPAAEETTTAATDAPLAATSPEINSEETTDKVEEPAAATTPANKRQSVLGSLGRRASKAIRSIQNPKKETTTPGTTTTEGEKAAETTESAPVAAKSETEPAIASTTTSEPAVENRPEAVTTTSTPAVTASA